MSSENVEVIGEENFWLYSPNRGYDLTHPPSPTSPLIFPRITLETTSGPVAIDPSKTALVIVDLQNYFLSPVLGRPSDSLGIQVAHRLLKHAVPACRKANIPIVWLGWGLTKDDIRTMPPTIIRGFRADTNSVSDKKIGDLGEDIGRLELENGEQVDGGLVLMKDQWNSEFWHPLHKEIKQDDIQIYKNRLDGFWGGTEIESALTSRGIKTLLFAGCNTDQCVGGSLQSAFTKGWDCLLLSDGTATTSPTFATQCIEYNTQGGWGFVLTCEQITHGVVNMELANSLNPKQEMYPISEKSGSAGNGPS
ncbi:Isochorismatase-like protein [Nemania sp. FL0031]|nr:Isochorismatase-like protein [Nemania sp. FL0031]